MANQITDQEIQRQQAVLNTIDAKVKAHTALTDSDIETICPDGTIHKQPAYGVDMQSAIARLVNQERTVKVEKQLYKNPFFVFLLRWLYY